MLAGQVIDGGCVSLTVMVNVQLGVPPVSLQVTVVVPFGKVDPEAGTHVMVQVPVGVGAG